MRSTSSVPRAYFVNVESLLNGQFRRKRTQFFTPAIPGGNHLANPLQGTLAIAAQHHGGVVVGEAHDQNFLGGP